MTGYEMFGERTNAIAENTIRTLFHIKVEQKVESCLLYTSINARMQWKNGTHDHRNCEE